ncbi:MAG: N-6 DNA methylase [Planctomycetaceae bacterium]|jgi:methylase of polypeptide subunit release factors|nr:N-6 DNA methylase [Planctomycetaceae bacterium]
MKIYAYQTKDIPKFAGFLKIGETTRTVKSRIKQQGHEIPIKKDVVWEGTVISNRTNIDKMIIRFLEKQGCEVIRFDETGEQSEWVKCEKEDVEIAFEKIKEQIRNEDKRKDLEQKFYEELRNWYFWATEETKNPDCSLRIIIRLLLCFFLREKELVPKELFEESFIKDNLKEDEYRYYKVIIRNLFFYSLNTPMQERRELENKNIIKNYSVVKKQFHENIPFLNGGLFTEHIGDDIPLNDDYFFTAPRTRTIKELDGKYPVAGIVYILSQYKYTLDEERAGDSVAGDLIDPEFIGKMFESLLAYIEADTKESRQKITGSYYTPREIVDYMVNEALEAYLLHNDDLLQCKILDPACGSGAFPCAIMNAILQRLDPQKKLTQAKRYQTKLKILQQVIYGVDIQPMAVQIAMLRLFLSLVQEIQPDKSTYNYGIESLPNLDYKFVAADTLIGIDCSGLFFNANQTLFNEILELKRDFFKQSDAVERARLRERIYRLEKDFADKSDNEGIQALCRWNHSDTANSLCFDSRWMFGVEKFDIVIGNPPYGADYPAERKKYFKEHYQSAKTISGKNGQKGSLDTFSLFIENGFNQVKQGGWVHFIVPMTIVSSDAMTGLHKLLEKNCETIKALSLSDRPQQIFPSAHQKTTVLQFCKDGKKNRRFYATQMYRKDEATALQSIIDNAAFINVAGLGLPGRYAKISLPIEKDILKKLRIIKTTIGTLRKDAGKPIYYRMTGGEYYKIVTNFSTESTKEKILLFDKNIADCIGAILSSSLLWWYNQVYTRYPDWKTSEIESFPIPIDKLTTAVIKKIKTLYAKYLRDIQKNVREHQTEAYKNINSFKEFKIRYSKLLIDEIDDMICPLYGLTDEERDFIKNYEIKFRIDE